MTHAAFYRCIYMTAWRIDRAHYALPRNRAANDHSAIVNP